MILVETRGRVGLITLNRPKALNALNDALMDELGDALAQFDADDNIGCIVITGSDKAFAAGADIGAMKDWSYMDVYKSGYISRNWERIRTVRKPVIRGSRRRPSWRPAAASRWRRSLSWTRPGRWRIGWPAKAAWNWPGVRPCRSSRVCRPSR